MPTYFKWVKGHNGDQGNKECDLLAKTGADKPIHDEMDLNIPATFDLQGAKLSAITQAIAYQGIIERLLPQQYATIAENLQTTREAIHAYNGLLEIDETIWINMQQRTLRTHIKQSLYKAIYSTQKLGQYWQHIPNHKDCELCTTCNVTESMEHILIHCYATLRTMIWRMARELWPHTPNLWPEISIGLILGCRSITLPPNVRQDHDDREEIRTQRGREKGARHLLQILLSEAAHLIWVLRCERSLQSS